MKRTLTGIAAAAMVLGTVAPAAFAATTASLTSGGGKSISVDGTTLYSGVQVGNGKDAGTVTTYFPIYYLQQALTKAGYTNTYDPSARVWNIQVPGVDGSKVAVDGGVGSGNSAIAINGFVVKRFNAQWNKDLAGGPSAPVTTYFPVFYLGNVLKAAGFTNAWDGNNFGFSSNYGAAAGVTLSAASASVVANGVSTDTVTVNVVDANGHVVRNFNGYANFGYTSTGQNGAVLFVKPDGSTGTSLTAVKVVNGQATFNVVAQTSANVTDAITATHVYSDFAETTQVDDSTWTLSPVSVNAVAQVATSIKVTSDNSYLADNNGGETDGVYAKVLDQNGKPMISGTYAVHFTVSGSATFDGVSATSTDGAGYGTGTDFSPATATVYSQKGKNGTVTVTATSGSLTGSVSLTEAPAQAGSTLKLSDTLTSNPTADGTDVAVTVQLTDANGLPVNAGVSGQVVNLSSDDSHLTIPSTATIASGTSSITFNVHTTTSGTYNITASATGLTSAKLPLTFDAGVATQFASPAIVNVPVSGTGYTVKAQLEDTNGNAVKTSGVTVEFSVDSGSLDHGHSINLGGKTVNSSNWGTTTYTATTDANGVATVTVTPADYVGDDWVIDATVPNQSGQAAIATAAVADVYVDNTVATKVNVTTQNGPAYTSSFTAGNTMTVTSTATDSNNNPTGADTITYTFSDPAAVTTPAATTGTYVPASSDPTNGVYVFTASAGKVVATFTNAKAGSYTVTAKDSSGSSTVSGTASFSTQAQQKVAGVAVYDASGKLISWTDGVTEANATPTANTIDASGNSAVALTLKAVDKYGNAVVTPNAVTTTLAANFAGGSFRATAGGNNIAGVATEFTIPAGQSSATVYYINGSSGATAVDVKATVGYTIADNSSTNTSLSAKVTDANGTVLQGVVVQFTKADGTVLGTAATNASGIATLTGTFTGDGACQLNIAGINTTDNTGATATTSAF